MGFNALQKSATPEAGGHRSASTLPREIWALGFVSMFMDISSEMIHSLLPVFLTSVLGAGAATIGLIESVGEATASFSKLISGWLSDRLGRRKLLTVAGYALGALSKPLFAIAPTPVFVLAARFSDRIGKGIRGAPRDALLGDIASPSRRGAAYGLRQALDTVGALAGPLIAIGLMASFADNFRLVFWCAVLPGAAAVAILLVFIRERCAEPAAPADRAAPGEHSQMLDGAYWLVVAIGSILTLARFSEAFLILRAHDAGLSPGHAPLVLVVMNLAYAFVAYPVGALSDRMDRKTILIAGFGVLIAADLVLALAPGLPAVFIGVAFWGVHMGMTQGLLSALVADAAPSAVRGMAFGAFHFAIGVATFISSLAAGALWEGVSPSAAFYGGAVFATAGLVGLMILQQRRKEI
jgi:MFS family permease